MTSHKWWIHSNFAPFQHFTDCSKKEPYLKYTYVDATYFCLYGNYDGSKPEPVVEHCLSGTASGMVVWSKTSSR